MPKNTLEISKLQKTISQFKKCSIENRQFHIRFHLERKEQSIVKAEIGSNLGKNDCDNHIWIYARRIETKPEYLRTNSALEWDQRYIGIFFPGQIAYWASLSHPHTSTLVYILASDKKRKAESRKQKGNQEGGGGEYYKGILTTGGEIHSQSWKTIMTFSKLLKNSNPSNCIDLLLWGKGRNIPQQ